MSAQPMLVHDVYFTLKDRSAEAKRKVLEACKKYLTDHPGQVAFAAGLLVEDLKRPVNDRDFDIGLHILFKNRAAHDEYQASQRHLQFVAENRENWQTVRVFDFFAENA